MRPLLRSLPFVPAAFDAVRGSSRPVFRTVLSLSLVAAAFTTPLIPGPLAAQAPQAPQAGQGEMVKLTFPNADVRDVLTQYELLVGKHVIYDNTVQGQVNINVPEVPREEAIRIIEITLIMNGYHLVPSDVDPNLIKATGIGRAPRSVGVPIFAEPEPIPENEQVIMYMVKLRYADPTELATVLQQAMPASRQEYAPNIVALPKAQALLVTENTTVLRGLIRIIRAADLEPSRVDGEFITLQRASAKDVVQMLEKLFEKPQSAGGGGSVPRPMPTPAVKPGEAPAAPGTPAPSPLTTVEIGGLNEDSMVSGKVRLTADERTNRIYVVSRPINLPILRRLIQQFDEDVPFNEPLVRNLKFVAAGDILDALVRAVSDPGTKDTATQGATTPGQNRPQTQTQSQSTSPFGGQFGNQSSRGIGSSNMSDLSLQSEQREIVPQTVLMGNARIMADKRRNAIIVIGSQDVKEKVTNLLDQLDVRTPQVMLTTVIGELTLSQDEQFGLNYLLHNGRKDLLTSGSGSAVTSGVSSVGPLALQLQQLLGNPQSTRMFTGGAGGLSGFVSAGDSLSAIVTALESTTKFKVTSRPSLFASNNKKATIISGESIAVVTGAQTGLGTGTNSTVNSVSYMDVSLNMQVIPLINSDKEVYLEIVQNLAEQIDEKLIDVGSGNKNSYPTIGKRQIQTAVTVPNEGTLVLGGLIKDTKKKTNAGIPVLSKVPLFGGLFRSNGKTTARTELIVLIRPSVTVGNDDTFDVRDRNLKLHQLPVSLEDELVFPDPAKGKKLGKAAERELKPFRTSVDSVAPNQVALGAPAVSSGSASSAPAAGSGQPGPPAQSAASYEPVVPVKKKAPKPQPKAAAQ